MWIRVFGSSDAVPDPAAIEAALGTAVLARSDESGWYRAEVACGASALMLERFLADEDGIRAELNAWAAFLETLEHSPHHAALMERTIQARQLITIRLPDEPDAGQMGGELARHLAAVTGGFYQIDGEGFFAADGAALVPER